MVLAVLGATTLARADGIGVVVTGDATLQPQTEAQVEEWLRVRGKTLVAAPLRPDSITALLDCFVIEDLVCARRVVDGAAVKQLVFARVEASDAGNAERNVTITAYWFRSGSEPQAVRRSCKSCDGHTIVDEVMASMAGKDAAAGTLSLTSSPAGARATVDGADVGVTPLEAPVSAGAHTVEVTKSGYARAHGTVIVAEGQSAKLDISMERGSHRSLLPYVIGGAGVALIATGIVLYATSEEDTGEKYEYRDTKPAGVVVALAGAAAIGAAAYLFVRGKPTDSAPAVAVTPGAGFVGWAGAF
ncbi:MAG TPA: PEGA domain-containing protein [Kofleriaceae bacterium]